MRRRSKPQRIGECAGITLYSPLRHWKAGPGKTVGIVGLGHMGVKIAHALGAKVVLFTTSPGKVADGKKLGADDVIISKNEEEMTRYKGKLDLIVNTWPRRTTSIPSSTC